MPSAARKKPHAPARVSKPRGPIRMYVTTTDQMSVFGLDPLWWDELRGRGAEPARSVAISADRGQDFVRIDGRAWRQVALILTGLTESMLTEEGVVLCDPHTDKSIARVF